MSTVTQPAAHIRLDEQGQAWLAGTTVKVIEVALDHLANGWSPEEIYLQHDRLLSLAQIHAALSYYYDHQEAFDSEIARQIRDVQTMRKHAGESPFRARLRAAGRL